MGESTNLVLVFLVVSCSAFVDSGVPVVRISQTSSDYWDMLVLTQFWPPAACLLMESEHKGCNLTADMTSWMIHGLWPTRNGTEGPNYCNSSWAFDDKILQVLQPRLGQNWPSITKDEKADILWRHEWEKHGTCATSLPALKDELHYFNQTLNLHERFNLSKALMNGRITPSNDKVYKFDDVTNALRKNTGSLPSLTCVRDKTNGHCCLEQIEVCLTKSFKPTDCASSSGRSAQHDLFFQSETAISGRSESDICHCESEGIYYKPLHFMTFPSRA